MLAIAFAVGVFGLVYGIEMFARIKHLQKLRQMQRYVHIINNQINREGL